MVRVGNRFGAMVGSTRVFRRVIASCHCMSTHGRVVVAGAAGVVWFRVVTAGVAAGAAAGAAGGGVAGAHAGKADSKSAAMAGSGRKSLASFRRASTDAFAFVEQLCF